MKLVDQSSRALSLTGQVIDGHREFSRSFYRALKSSSDTGELVLDYKMEASMEKIKKRAGRVAQTVAVMKDDLQAMANLLERATSSSSKKPGRMERAKKWLRKACRVLVAILSVGATLATVLLHPHVGAVLGVGSLLSSKLEKALGKGSDGTSQPIVRLFLVAFHQIHPP